MAEAALQLEVEQLRAQLAAAQVNQRNAAAQNEVFRVSAKPPPFSKENPDLFFIQSEAQFATAGITQDSTKYYHVVGNLDPKILNFVSDFLRDPPAVNKYEQLKARILREFTDSDIKKLRRVMTECELGDEKPSQLLKRMKDLAGTKFTDDALKTLWLGRLPESVRAVVSTIEGDSAQWAKVADKMMEVTSFAQVSTINKSAAPNQPQNEIAELRKDISEIKTFFKQRGRSEQRDASKSRNQSRSKSKDGNKVCYYHSRFGTKAKKCTKPCEFKADSGN